MGGERRKKEGEGGEGREEGDWGGPTKNSCRGAQNVKLRHSLMVIQVEIYFVTSATLNGIWCIVIVSDLQTKQQMLKWYTGSSVHLFFTTYRNTKTNLTSSSKRSDRWHLRKLLLTRGFSKTRRNADGTAVSKYIGQDSPQSVDNYPISTQNPTTVARSVVLSSLLLFHLLSHPMYLLIAVPLAVPSFRLILGCPLTRGVAIPYIRILP